MTKRSIFFWFDKIFWYALYMLPLLLGIFVSIQSGSLLDFSTLFSATGISFVTDNFVYVALDSLFGATGVVPMFADTFILHYMTWFVCCYLIHMFVDAILFLPRLIANQADKWSKRSDD